MAVPSVFLSSVVVGFEDVRDAAAAAIRGVGMHAVRSEELSAEAGSSRSALLGQVADADLYLLVLGERYGDYGADETSPTEDEYDEALRLHKPIFVVVQEGEREARQQQFLERVCGTWGEGAFHGHFTSAGDVGSAVAAALGRRQAGVAEDGPAAQERALALAGEEERYGPGSGIAARVALVPLRQTTLLDAVALDQPGLGDELAGALRRAGAVPQSIGIESKVSGAGIQLTGNAAESWVTPAASVDTAGGVTVLGSVAVEGGPLGFSAVDPERLRALISRAGAAAQLIYDRIDPRGEVGQVAVAAAILGASYKGYGAPSGSSMSVSRSLPAIVVGPDPAEIVPRARLAREDLARRIEAAIKRVFADAGALQG
jgi:Domain of unknown function (DUF4062)